MKEWLKKNLCKVILVSLQSAFLGGGYVYIEEFKEIRDQIKTSETIVTKNLNKLTETAQKADNALKKTNNTLEKVEDVLKETKKACKRLF